MLDALKNLCSIKIHAKVNPYGIQEDLGIRQTDLRHLNVDTDCTIWQANICVYTNTQTSKEIKLKIMMVD